jgi:hypothetical protein
MVALKRSKLQVIVFIFGLSRESIFFLAKAASKNEMLTPKHLYIHTMNDLTFGDSSFPENVTLIREFLRGSLSLQNSVPGMDERTESNPSLDAFYKAWPTFSENDVNIWFPKTTDVIDHTRFYFPPGYFRNTTSDIFNAFTWAYDAVATVGLAACELDPTGQLGNSSRFLTTIRNQNFQGLSGHVLFDKLTGDRDPHTSVYRLMNAVVDPTGLGAPLTYRTIGLYLPSKLNWTIQFSNATFRDGTSKITTDVEIPFHETNYLPSWSQVLGIVECCIGLLLGLLSLAWLWFKRKSLIVIQSQPVFMSLIALGICLLATSIIPLTIENSDSSCMAFPFLFSMGLCLVTCGISAKSIRVGRLWYRLTDRKQDRGVVYLMFALIAILLDLILLILWSVTSPLTYIRTITETDVNGYPTQSFGMCTLNPTNQTASIVFLCLCVGYLALLVISTGIVSIWVHNAPEKFQDAKMTAIGACCLGQVYLLGIPIVILLYYAPIPRFLVLSTLVLLTFLVLFGVLFMPKILSLIDDDSRKSSNNSMGIAGNSPNNNQGRKTEGGLSPLLGRGGGKNQQRTTSPAPTQRKPILRMRFSPAPISRLGRKGIPPAQQPQAAQDHGNEDVRSRAKAHRSDFNAIDTPSNRKLQGVDAFDFPNSTADQLTYPGMAETPEPRTKQNDVEGYPVEEKEDAARVSYHMSTGDASIVDNEVATSSKQYSSSKLDSWANIETYHGTANEDFENKKGNRVDGDQSSFTDGNGDQSSLAEQKDSETFESRDLAMV